MGSFILILERRRADTADTATHKRPAKTVFGARISFILPVGKGRALRALQMRAAPSLQPKSSQHLAMGCAVKARSESTVVALFSGGPIKDIHCLSRSPGVGSQVKGLCRPRTAAHRLRYRVPHCTTAPLEDSERQVALHHVYSMFF